MSCSIFLFTNLGWGSKFETSECRTTNISEFQSYEYQNKDVLFDSFIFVFIFLLYINYWHNLIIFQIVKY